MGRTALWAVPSLNLPTVLGRYAIGIPKGIGRRKLNDYRQIPVGFRVVNLARV